MSENVLHTLQQLVQDVIAPDVRELKVRIAALEKVVESLEKHMDVRFNLSDQKSDAQFRAIMAAISESRAQENSPVCVW
jgi:tetrahydromethanopterin S-methyltransferase subunit B